MMRFWLFLLLATLTASPAFATAKVQEVKAANGATAWLIEDHTLPIVTLKVAFEASGSAADGEGKQGLASFTGQMLDEGAGDMDSFAFQSALDDHAIRLSADTGEDLLTFGMQTLSEFKPEALRLFNLAVNHPRFDDEAVERVRASIVSDLTQMEANPTYLASRRWKELAFGTDAYTHPKRGTPASVAALTRADLQAFARDHFACPQRVIAVVGDITAREAEDWLGTFSPGADCARHGKPAAAALVMPESNGSPAVVTAPVPQTVTIASFPAALRSDPRYYAVYVLNQILGGNSLTSRLGREIRDKRGLAYYAESYVDTLDHAAYLLVHFATRSEEARAAYGVFADTIKNTAANGVTQTEFDEAKSYLTGSFPLQLDNENSLAEYLLVMQHYALGADYLDKRNGYINAVTFRQVNEEAKTILSHAPLAVMAGEPAASKK